MFQRLVCANRELEAFIQNREKVRFIPKKKKSFKRKVNREEKSNEKRLIKAGKRKNTRVDLR